MSFNVRKIADRVKRDGGISINHEGEEPRLGYMVCEFPEYEVRVASILSAVLVVHLKQFLDDHFLLLAHGHRYLGIWVDVYAGEIVIDVSTCVRQLDYALDKARKNKQLAVFDVANLKEIWV